jgi:murein DD-endopeptidase MepM/ murein hydrolase activator NlpD
MTGGFLLAIVAVVLAIVIAAPQYAEPAPAAVLLPDESSEPSSGLASVTTAVPPEPPTSRPPDKLKGYGWPVRGGGDVAAYYAFDPAGDFEIDGRRVHDGLVITWFEGAAVKAAHKGTVVAAGPDWAHHVGFDGSLDEVYARYASSTGKKSKKPQFPLGVVIDDGNGYYSVYTELKDLRVAVGDKVKVGQAIAGMSRAERKQMMRYRLVRMDGPLMKVDESARERGYPFYARERVDPLAVLDVEAKRKPRMLREPPGNPPRLSQY